MSETWNYLTARVRLWKIRLVNGLVLGLLTVIGVPAVRADHIDDSLIKASRELAQSLNEKGFKNIGVLKFLVKKGNGRSDGNAGALNMNMAERIEWALIHGMEESKPLAVIQNATQVAARGNPHLSIKTPQARKAFFSQKYPLHWGNERVTPDVFLTGTVDLSSDMRSAKVDVGYFDKSGTIHELKQMTVKTDPSILADSGQSFAISKRSLKKKKRDLSELDDDAADSASKADQGTSVDKQLNKDNDSAPLQFDILYNGTAATKTPDSNSPGEFRVDSPQSGTTVTFQMVNKTQDKIAVVVKVNGLNTIGKEDNDDQACTKWILEPGKAYGLRGYYVDDKVYVFQVLSDDESAARVSDEAFKGRGGWIDVTVFPQGSAGDDTAKTSRSLRGLGKHGSKAKPKTLVEARALVNKHLSTAAARRKSKGHRGLIVEGNAQDQKLETDDFQISPVASYHMQINYYSAQTTGTDGSSK